MLEIFIFLIIAVIAIFVITYRKSNGEKVYKYFSQSSNGILGKVSPYSYKEVRKKIKELGQVYLV